MLPEKAGRANKEKPLCTVNPKAAQRPSSTGLRDENRFRRVTVGMEMHRHNGGNTRRHHSAFSRGDSTLPTRSHREGQVRPKEGPLHPSSQGAGRGGEAEGWGEGSLHRKLLLDHGGSRWLSFLVESRERGHEEKNLRQIIRKLKFGV